MKKLLQFLITNLTDTSDFEIETREETGREILIVKADPTIIGLIIGKAGKTIKNLRKIVAIRAALENKLVNISIEEKE